MIARKPPATAIDPQVERHKTALLYRNAGVGQLASVVNASLLAYVSVTLRTPAEVALGWWLMVAGIAAGRFLLARAFRQANPDAAASAAWRRRYIAGTMIAGVAWGAGSVLFLWDAPDGLRLFTGLVLAGMVAGSVPILAPVPAAFKVYAALIVLPLTAVVFAQASSALHWVFGATTLIFLWSALASGRYLHEVLDGEIRLGAEKGRLLESLELACGTAEAALDRSRQAEATLQASEERYRLLLQHSPTGLFHYDNDLVITYCNDRFAQILKAPKDRLLGLDMKTLKDQRVLPALRAAVDGRADSYEGPYLTTLSDKEIWVTMSCVPFRTSNEADEGGIAIIEDVTARKIAEGQLRKLSRAVEQTPESILITDLAGNIDYVNEAFVRKTGYGREEVIGKNPRILKSDNTPPETHEALWQTLTRGQTWSGQLHNRLRDGSEIVVFAIITPIRDDDGTVTHYVAIEEDITESKRTAEELDRHRHRLEELVKERTEQLEQAKLAADAASVAKSAFLANMSHEIRTPLNAITGMAHLIRRAGLTSGQAERLDKLEAAGAHLLEVINEILDLSKIEAGKAELEQAPVLVETIIGNVASMLHDRIQSRGLQLVVDVQPLPPHLLGDPTRLQQAVLNYASNAAKFTEHGSITLHVHLEHEDADAAQVRFEVRDTGIGVAPEALPRLFSAFEQADGGTTRKYGGTGLGLAITKRLAELMGGEAGVVSIPGQGSTFWFTARLAKGVSPGKAPAARLDGRSAEEVLLRDHAGKRVLLVEDEPVNREIALMLLQDAGLVVDTAEDGVRGLELATDNAYDAILMDMQMPRMDGMEATRRIRRLPRHGATPIIALTANVFVEDRTRCLEAGMDDFVPKPVDPEQLYTILLDRLSGDKTST